MKITNINMLGFIIDWMNETGEKIADIILKPFMSLPGFIKMLVTFGFAILIVIGAICVARKALKTVVGIACLFVIVLIVWLIIIIKQKTYFLMGFFLFSIKYSKKNFLLYI